MFIFALVSGSTIKKLFTSPLMSKRLPPLKVKGFFIMKTGRERHKLINHILYRKWATMKSKCNDPNNTSYKYYGGRGIRVCEEWENDFISFYNWSINNGWIDGLTIDRINNNGNYEPSNCRFATMKMQLNNTRRSLYIIYKNRTYPAYILFEKLGLPNKYHSELISKIKKNSDKNPIEIIDKFIHRYRPLFGVDNL